MQSGPRVRLHIKWVGRTGAQDEDAARGTLGRGALDCIARPFDLEDLERVVAAAVSRRRR